MNYFNEHDEKINNGNTYNYYKEISNKEIIESLFNFLKGEENKHLNEMIMDLINYNKSLDNIENLEQEQKTNFKYALYQYLQKNILEIIYIKDKDKKEEMINKIYLWYKDKIKLYDELKYIKIKSYNSPEEIDDEKYVNEKYKNLFEERKKYISQTERIKNEMRHRSLQSYNKDSIESFNNYKRKHILKVTNNKKKLSSKINLEKSKYDSIKRNNFILNSKYYKNKKNNDINLPLLNYSILKANKAIIESKNKLFAEKRSQEETDKKVNEFGMNKAKYKTSLINKYEIKEIINKYAKKNNFNSLLLKKYKNNKMNYNLKSDSEKNNSKYLSIDKLSLKNVSEIYGNINNEVEEFNIDSQIEETSYDTNRKMKKYNTQRIKKISRALLKKIGNKVITGDIHNLDHKTNEIIDNKKENIIYKNIILKFPEKKINRELLNNCLNNQNVPYDSISKLTFHNDIFKQKLIYRRILNISNDRSSIHNYSLEKNIFRDEYEFKNNDNYKNNYNLSAYNNTNIEEIKKFKNFSNCSERKKNKNVKIYKINNNYNLYKDNYLNLRKSISNFRKSEYQELINLSKKKSSIDIKEEGNNNENKHSKKEYKDNLDDKILFKNKIKIIKDKNINNLSSAILNPNESNTFSKYYLPRPGSLLLNK